MRPAVLVAAFSVLHVLPAAAADLDLLQRELDAIDARTVFAGAPLDAATEQRRNRLQEQLAAVRAAIASAPRVIVVNVPAYTLSAYEDGQPVLESRVIVGATDRRTPLMETEVEGVQLNPSWTAPPKVVKGDLIRKGGIDERAVRRKGLTVLDANGHALPPEALAFVLPEQTRHLRFYQPPGDDNALGQVKIMLKGVPDIYLHDTPNKALFRKNRRAMSSGCVRVEKARDLAAWLTGKSPAELAGLIDAKNTRTVAARPTKVVLGYWLADTAEDKVVFVDDVYRLAAQSVPALGATAVATAAVAASADPPRTTSEQPPVDAAPPAVGTGAAVRTEPEAAPAAGIAAPAVRPGAAPASAPSVTADVAVAAPPVPGAAPASVSAIASAPPPASTVQSQPRRALITPANVAPWVGQYVRAALAGLDLYALRAALGWHMPPSGAPARLTLTIDRDGYVRAAEVDRTAAAPQARDIARRHFARYARTLPFPAPLARDLDEVVVPVAL